MPPSNLKFCLFSITDFEHDCGTTFIPQILYVLCYGNLAAGTLPRFYHFCPNVMSVNVFFLPFLCDRSAVPRNICKPGSEKPVLRHWPHAERQLARRTSSHQRGALTLEEKKHPVFCGLCPYGISFRCHLTPFPCAPPPSHFDPTHPLLRRHGQGIYSYRATAELGKATQLHVCLS